MRLLLDTHVLIWLAEGSAKLADREKALIAAPGSKILMSMVSLWEIRIKWTQRHSSGERKGTISPEQAMIIVDRFAWEWLPITLEDCATVLQPALTIGDPFDTMLLIQAGRAQARLLTHDRNLRDHPNAYS